MFPLCHIVTYNCICYIQFGHVMAALITTSSQSSIVLGIRMCILPCASSQIMRVHHMRVQGRHAWHMLPLL